MDCLIDAVTSLVFVWICVLSAEFVHFWALNPVKP